MIPKAKCIEYREHVSDHGKITAYCKVLDSTPEGQIHCSVANCSLFKTHRKYNNTQIEAQIAEYGRTHE